MVAAMRLALATFCMPGLPSWAKVWRRARASMRPLGKAAAALFWLLDADTVAATSH